MDKNRDYSKLEGKELKWVGYDDIDGDFTYIAIVGNIDCDIGITLVDKNNPKDELTCINGPSSPQAFEGFEEKYYEDLFDYVVSAIENGLYEGVKSYKVIGQSKSSLSELATCAFK